MSEKKKFWQTPEHMEGFGQAFVVSEDQKLDWGDLFHITTLPTQSRMPHLFPQLPLPLRWDTNDEDELLPPSPQPEKIVSSGTYRSIEHRATVNSEKERISIATFYSPRQDGVIGPWPSLITKQTPAQFKRI
ncbi:Protein SRG1 [Glycine soja]|uniref:Protein SRG1 n=1 Tax=Glycine soja TaxID=3848 RepID=A0A445IAG5_GLYSO|nr:Protein SRG1 [Glycine soja]